jgi:hypothetical protein
MGQPRLAHFSLGPKIFFPCFCRPTIERNVTDFRVKHVMGSLWIVESNPKKN